MRVAFSDWRVGGILSARSGQPINIIAGQDRAFTGIQNQRVNQVLDNPYGDKKTPNTWLNPAAFAQPAPGTLGNFKRNSVRAPGYWAVDLGGLAARFRRYGSHAGAAPGDVQPAQHVQLGPAAEHTRTPTGRTTTSTRERSGASLPWPVHRASCSSA